MLLDYLPRIVQTAVLLLALGFCTRRIAATGRKVNKPASHGMERRE